jgi:hypothetical protein
MSANDETDDDRFDHEYDFSRGVRGKFVQRVGEAPAWVWAVAQQDVQRQLGETLLKLQEFQAWLVAYHALVFGLEPADAGHAAMELMDASVGDQSASLWVPVFKNIPTSGGTAADLRAALQKLLQERNWVVHHSFQDVQSASSQELATVATRLAKLADRAEFLRMHLYNGLVRHCERAGTSEHQVRQRVEAAIEEWAAA